MSRMGRERLCIVKEHHRGKEQTQHRKGSHEKRNVVIPEVFRRNRASSPSSSKGSSSRAFVNRGESSKGSVSPLTRCLSMYSGSSLVRSSTSTSPSESASENVCNRCISISFWRSIAAYCFSNTSSSFRALISSLMRKVSSGPMFPRASRTKRSVAPSVVHRIRGLRFSGERLCTMTLGRMGVCGGGLDCFVSVLIPSLSYDLAKGEDETGLE